MTTRAVNSRSGNGRTVYTILLSVCLFLGVICACLLVALVLIGKNLASQSLESKNCSYDNSTTSLFNDSSKELEYLNDASSFDNGTSNEISVKINVNTDPTLPKYSSTPVPDWRSGWRLPRDVKPLHYDLTMRPNLTDATFTGKNNITIQITEPCDHFVLHGYLLNVSAVEMYTAETNERVDVINFHNDSLHQLWVVDLEDTAQPGVYYLILEFSANMTGKRIGMYTSTYLDENDNRRYIATTKFEPTYARQAFPCFDEPNYKAKYTVHIEKPKGDGYIALSNMDQMAEPPQSVDDNNELVSFNTSVAMSTYVTCFIVCDFNYTEEIIEPVHGNPIKLRVYATPAQVQKTQFALDVAAKVTKYYVDYFGIEYPLPKLDMIAIPDFVSGAMEHWGLVTYRETALLYDEKTSNAANKQRVATVVAHELAHMWFGNLVTLDWWNDLWLNEGFATYMQFKAINEIIQDWGMVDQFLIDQVHPVMNFDATLASHPIVQTVTTPNQITEIFDSISYNKGAAVLRMLENALGDDIFRTGIQKYLEKYKFGNAVTKNLWDELQIASPEIKIKDFMDTWTVQMGYPVITVTQQNDTFILTQRRFLTDPENNILTPPSVLNYRFTIPITYITDADTRIETKLWFDKDDVDVRLELPGIKWLKINHKQVGYYRVNYNPHLWTNLTTNIMDLEISNRANLLDDAFSLAKAGQVNYKIPLDISDTLVTEKEYVPWVAASKRLRELQSLLKTTDIYENYQKYIHTIIKPVYDELSWNENDTESHQNKLLRGKILDLGCSFGLEECKNKTKDQFSKWLNENADLPVSLKGLVYSYGMEEVSLSDWNKVFNIYMKEIDAQEKMRLLSGLTSVKNTEILRDLLKKAENENIVRSQDYFTCLQYISGNSAGTGLVWDYVRENWNELVKRFTLNDRYLGRLIPAITSSFSTEIKLQEMKSFFEMYPDAGAGEISRKEALETVKNNIQWNKKYQNEVKEWLDRHVK